jgi:serine/threonine-protein kinase HipA
VRLAPSYDVASALPYDYRETKTKLAMKVGDHYRLDRINRSSWCRSAQALGLDPAEAVDRVALNVSRVADAFSTAAFELDSDLSSSATVPALVDAVARRVERCTSLLA